MLIRMPYSTLRALTAIVRSIALSKEPRAVQA
jgi:hypothetical protein